MVDIAARTTRGVKHLSRKQTRQHIIQLFKDQMKALRDQLNVCTPFMIRAPTPFLRLAI